jgi:hypothetical protein
VSPRNRKKRDERAGRNGSTEPRRRGDTFAWLWAAFQVVAPFVLALIGVILLAYGLIHVLFFR